MSVPVTPPPLTNLHNCNASEQTLSPTDYIANNKNIVFLQPQCPGVYTLTAVECSVTFRDGWFTDPSI